MRENRQLFEAARDGDPSIVRRLLIGGADVDGPVIFDVDSPDASWPRALSTPLKIAAARGHGDVVRVLLAAGANPNHQSPGSPDTPLCIALALARERAKQHGWRDVDRRLRVHRAALGS
jgi:hypothetical protein